MKFRFSLEKVLVHRRLLESLAQKDFQEAQAEALHQQRLLEQMQADLQDARRVAGDQVQSAQTPPESLKQIHDFTVLQAIRIERQKAKVLEAENLVEAKREILRAKALETKMMERLKEKKRAEFLKEEDLREQRENDELSILRFKAGDSG